MFSQKPPTSLLFSFGTGCILVIALLSLSCVTNQKISDTRNFIVEKNEKPWVIAHRGGRGLFPENTMAAFDGAHELAVDALEMDVCLTKDNQLVTHHDLTIDRTSNGKGNLIDHTLQELQKLNFGYHFKDLNDQFIYRENKVKIPTMDEVMAKYSEKYPLIIEIKNKSENGFKAAQKLFDLIQKYKIESKVIVASFHGEVLEKFRAISQNKIITATTLNETKKFVVSKKLAMPFLFKPDGGAALQIPMKAKGLNLSKASFTKMAHKRDMIIHYWTINTKENMRKLIEYGVDGIMTDRPDLLIELYKEMKLK